MNRASLSVLLGVALSLAAGAAVADVVPVVSARSAVMALSNSQLTDIFLCKVSHFPNGSPAVPIDLAEDSPGHDEFYARFFGKTPAQIKAFWSKIIFTGRGQPPKAMPSGAAMKKFIAENLDAIGYLERELVDGSVKVLAQP
jgi:hypothetical protein